jgi:hypothetical protein
MRIFPALVLSSALATAAAGVVLVDDDPSEPPAAEQAGAAQAPRVAAAPDPDDPHTWQTSDQVPGEIAAPLQPGQRATLSRRMRFSYRVVPGVQATGWQERTRRGPVRYFVLRVKWQTPGVTVDYAHGGKVRRTQSVTSMLARTPGAVAGVNGDFFDIGDTGAPLGLGAERRVGMWKGVDSGWNAAIYQGDSGRIHLGTLPMVASLPKRPDIRITNFNAPQVKIGGIGLYTHRWGRTSGLRWTDGQRRHVRLVHIVDGVVVANRQRAFPEGDKIVGQYLIARGDKAEDKLQTIKKGTRIGFRAYLEGTPRFAISGNVIVLKRRKILAVDDREMHPRTAVGIDRGTKQLIFLVVDGRQRFSRGYTMVEIAKRLRALGADDALNLDGGGSTTLAARRSGRMRVLNSPSDGTQRSVPNGLEVIYRRK